MRGFLRYNGQSSVHAFKIDWQPGMEIPLDKVFALFSDKCTVTKKLDENFITWFLNKFSAKLEQGFELVVPHTLKSMTSPVSDGGREDMVLVESAEVETASSLDEAREKLKRMRHEDAVGIVDRSTDEEISLPPSKGVRSLLQNQPKPGSEVMTGDDLSKNRNISSLVLDGTGEAKKASLLNEDVRAEQSAAMANLSKRAAVLTPMRVDEFGYSQQDIVSEDDPNKPSVGFSKKVITTDSDDRKVNKGFKAYPTMGTPKKVSPEDIVTASKTSHKEALKLINICKDVTTLKVAKIYCKNIGEQSLVEAIDVRIHALPRIGE